MHLLSPRLRAQIIKELLSVLRDPKSRLILIGPPLLQLLIFSFAATLEVRNVDIAVYDRDAGRWSQELVARVGAAGFVHRLHPVHSPAELTLMIERREVIAAIDIPEQFSREIVAGREAKAQVILDGRRANSGQVVFGYLNAIASGLGAELNATGQGAGQSVAVRHWFNPNLIYLWFVVPGIGGILVSFEALLITALSIARERELGTFDQLLVSPCTPLEIIVAKMAPGLMICTVLGLFMMAAAVFAFGIPFTGSFWLLFLSLELFTLSMLGIGLAISAVSSTQQQGILGAFSIMVPATLMSGFATPVENMPLFLQWVAQAIPLKHYLIILQGSFLKALPLPEILVNAWPMAVIALITLTIATLFVRSKLQ
ncbi:MAG: ABC transporter permease [Proteobacteria bacterium]|nr:ABC transporter permease [Pseudomonadota bacterium]